VTSLLHAEVMKLRTTRTFVALTGAALALSLLVVVLASTLSNEMSDDEARDLFTADFTGLFILLLGVMGSAGEWRHRTITSSILAAPRRWRLLAAKTLAYAAAGALVSLIVSLTIMAVGVPILESRNLADVEAGELADVLWRNLLVSAFLGALGVGVGALVRNQVVGIVALLVFSFALEPVVLGLAPEWGRFGPTSGAPNAIIDVEAFGEDDEQLSPAAGILVMLAWVGAVFAAAGVLFQRRDVA
jgi:ABC-2 type transport system permease protein